MELINKDKIVKEIEKRIKELQDLSKENEKKLDSFQKTAINLCIDECKVVLNILNTLEVKEVERSAPIAYIVTRCEEHSDYVEKVFFNEDKAQEYCDQFKGNENEYARHITRVEVTL